ncbi:MAG: AAA family ATPase, partial [Actinobacteria bacterium]|nr:AAA family ATPase [Actinomycetota bacterium]
MADDTGTPGAQLDAPWPLVGREDAVEKALNGLRSSARSVFVHGHSGAGKSRFAHECAARLEDEGWLVHRASGNPALTAIPLGTLSPVLVAADPETLRSAGDAVSLFAAVSQALVEQAAGRRLLLVLDDVAAADSVSLTLVAQLVEAGVVRLICASPEGAPLPESVIPLAASPDACRIDLAPLDLDQASELFMRVLGSPLAHRHVVELHQASTGNPLFLRELALGAAAAGRLRCVDGIWQLTGEPVGTPALHDLIRARLSGLTEAERD